MAVTRNSKNRRIFSVPTLPTARLVGKVRTVANPSPNRKERIMSDMDKAMGFMGMLGQKAARGARQLASKLQDEKYLRDVRKRGMVEAQTQSLLKGAQLKRYNEILACIAADRAVASNVNMPMDERARAVGRVEGNRAIRDKIEKTTREVLKPKKKQQQQKAQPARGQQRNQQPDERDSMFYDESIFNPNQNQAPPASRSRSGNRSRGKQTAGSRR